MIVTLYQHNKKQNSTALPSGGTSFDCQAYDPCSIVNPVVLIAGDDVHDYNYAYISSFQRYYWVTDAVWSGGLWEVHLTCDVLSSYRDAIGSSQQYISRSSAESNRGIDDSAFVSYASPVTTSITIESPWHSGKCYVIGVMGDLGIQYFIINESQLVSLMLYIFSDAYAEQVLEEYAEIYPQLKANLNPLQYVTYLKYFPVDFPTSGGGSISVGWVTTPVTGLRAAVGSYFTERLTISIPKHPQAGQGSYLNLAPYSEYTLIVPPFGLLTLPPEKMAMVDTLGLHIKIDPHSGDASLRVHTPDDSTITYVHGRLGVDIQLAQIVAPGWGTGNTAQAVATGLSAAAGLISNPILGLPGAISTITNTIGNVASSKVPYAHSVGGGSGGAAAWQGDIQLTGTFLPVVGKDTANKGNPLCAVRTISSVAGYIECYWPHLEIAATQGEINQLMQYMTGGFYYE